MTKFTIENRYRLYEDDNGDYIEVEPDVALKIAELLTKAANDVINQQKIDFPDG